MGNQAKTAQAAKPRRLSFELAGLICSCGRDSQFIDPSIVKCHPSGLGAGGKFGGLDIFPKGPVVETFPSGDGIDMPAALVGQRKGLDGLGNDGACRRYAIVMLAPPPHDQRADTQHDCGEQVAEPEANILFGVDHGQLTNKGTDINKEVEEVVDSVDGNGRVHDYAFASLWEGFDAHMLNVELFDNQRVDVGLEATGSEADNENGDDHGSKRTSWFGNDGRNGRQDQNDMADDINA